MAWYSANGRHELPWRLTRDPYAVLVSEVMLQQTQVERVLPRYQAWMKRWPTAVTLSEASLADVIREWSGLGYNRRAVRLHQAARLVATSGFPMTASEMQKLPGVGAYTAAAVASFALEQRVAVADTNIARCIARVIMAKSSQRDVPRRAVSAATEALLPADGTRDHNLALMDLGAAVCRARSPLCSDCPVRERCAWRRAGYPVQEAQANPVERFETTARFARGRIVEVLRAADHLSTDELVSRLPESHKPHLARYLSGLERDGLVARTPGGEWGLPGSEVTAG